MGLTVGLTRKDWRIRESYGNPMEIRESWGGAKVPKSVAVGLTRKDWRIRESYGNPMGIRDSGGGC